MNQAWSAHDAKDPGRTVYRTYDEQGVSRETIDRALLVLDPLTYWSFDEQPIAELEVRQAIRAAALRHERLVRVRENFLRLAMIALCAIIVVGVWLILSH